jgi:murein tripeptide amidase MpaA
MHCNARLARALLVLGALALLVGASPPPGAAESLGSARDPDPRPPQHYRVVGAATREQRSAIVAAGADIVAVGPGFVEVVAAPAQAARLAALGYATTLLPRASDFAIPGAAYHTYDEMVAAIQAVGEAHPAIVRLFSIGRSYEGRELWAAKISDNPGADEDEPEALFVGQHHAREHLTVEMLLYLLRALAGGYGQPHQAQITRLVDTREIYLIFSLNPDGGEYDTATGYYQLWRKNRQPNRDGSFGTDLNRNHSFMWGCCGGSSGEPAGDTYRGPSPASAPETRALESFVNSRLVGGVQQITVAISFHTFGELVMWPYAHTYAEGPPAVRAVDQAIFAAAGRAMAATNGYTPMQASDLYISDGDFADWAYGFHRIYAYTFEMYPNFAGPQGFYPPAPAIEPETRRNRAAVLYLLELAGCPYDAIGQARAYCVNGRLPPPRRVWLPVSLR